MGLITNIVGILSQIMFEYVKQRVVHTPQQVGRHQSEYKLRFQYFKWLTPTMEDQLCQVLTACKRSRFLLTNTVPNELK